MPLGHIRQLCAMLLALTCVPGASFAQSPASDSSVAVPRLMNLNGVFQPADGLQPRPVEVITLSVYADEVGGVPLWQESQTVRFDDRGRYAVLVGATTAEGIPPAVLAAGARWLGTRFDRAGEVEGPRVRLTTVPYALRAADADTLGGRPASAYLLAPTGSDGQSTESASTSTAASGEKAASTSGRQPSATTQAVLPGTVNFLSKYVNAADVGDSAVFESAGRVGIGTTAPSDVLHIRFTNPGGSLTGIAVQNMSGTATSYSGTLFYDHNGVLGQFQGFNNVTHEYRINNIAKNGGSVFDGSINFMVGGASKFFVSPVSVGIGTTSPASTSNLDVSNAISGSGTTNINVTTYNASGSGPNVIGKHARGTQAAPTAVLNNDALMDLSANGYGATAFASTNSAGISMRASENWTDTAQGSVINFSTTANGTTGSSPRMTLSGNGNLGVGIFSAAAKLEVSNSNIGSSGSIFGTTFASAGSTTFVGRRARGTGIAPTAALSGDILAGYLGAGYGSTVFSGTRGGMFVQAAETFTDAAQGTRVFFNTTGTGTNTPSTKMSIGPEGNVGIGTMAPSAPLEIARTGSDAGVVTTAYLDGSDAGSFHVSQTARGTAAAPTAVQAGDFLGAMGFAGYAATQFGSINAAIAGFAAENFTDTAQGTTLAFGVTPIGDNDVLPLMALLPSGFVGIATPPDGNGLPTATDRLQVFGDIRVGDSGTNGCLKRFDGNFLVGTCVSDRRFKRNITPFGRVLDQVSALQPVNYYWRAAEFPEKHFGNSQAYGLIAQDVEQILPELVVTTGDGYKAVDYTKLPLLTIEAVKELKAENDQLKQRVDELERLLKGVLDFVPESLLRQQ